jgi:opacity protein-like surface antigen
MSVSARHSRMVAAPLACLITGAPIAEPKLDQGVRELSLHISPDFESAIGDTIVARVGYGVFVRDRVSLRGTIQYMLMEDIAGNDADFRTLEYTLLGEYHFKTPRRVVPYLGAGIGWTSSEFGLLDESAFVYGPRAGVKYFMADNAALDLEVAYRFATADVFISDFVAEDADLTVGIGMRFLW